MASKLTLIDISSGFKGTDIQTNFTSIEDEFDDTLSRSGKSPNQMEANIDMNSNLLRNLGVPTSNSDAARLKDLSEDNATSKAATAVTLEDTGGFYSSDNVEGALEEIHTDFSTTTELENRGFTEQVDSVSDLQSGSFPASLDRIWLSGYYGVGTAGGGPLYRDSADTTTADNGGTVFVDADGVRWKRPDTGIVFAEDFGAVGDGTTDDQPAIQSALDDDPRPRSTVRLMSRTYAIGATLEIKGGRRLMGAASGRTEGSEPPTRLVPASSGLTVMYVSGRHDQVGNISLNGDGTGKGIAVGESTTGGAKADRLVLESVFVKDFSEGIHHRQGNACFYKDIFIQGCTNFGFGIDESADNNSNASTVFGLHVGNCTNGSGDAAGIFVSDDSTHGNRPFGNTFIGCYSEGCDIGVNWGGEQSIAFIATEPAGLAGHTGWETGSSGTGNILFDSRQGDPNTGDLRNLTFSGLGFRGELRGNFHFGGIEDSYGNTLFREQGRTAIVTNDSGSLQNYYVKSDHFDIGDQVTLVNDASSSGSVAFRDKDTDDLIAGIGGRSAGQVIQVVRSGEDVVSGNNMWYQAN